MLRHAFETHKVQRVALRADARNARSLSAIRKLGAHFEGINRRSSIDRFGVCRDMATFGIIPEDWAGIRDGLIKRLGYTP
jgi:RimJ/RimL family protein N-acetyltransferase